MSKEKSAFDEIWKAAILPAIELCKRDLDKKFETEAKASICNMEEYKEKLRGMYRRKREWLKREYLPNESDPVLDLHKLSAIVCRSIIGVKPFAFDVDVAEKNFCCINNDGTESNHLEKVKWQIDNLYINYKLAFLVAEGIIFIDLVYWAQQKINFIMKNFSESEISENVDKVKTKLLIYKEFIRILNDEKKQLYQYPESDSHDSFYISSIIALMKNDYLQRDFDYLQFAISMFQWQEYTKKQLLYDVLKSNNFDIELRELVKTNK